MLPCIDGPVMCELAVNVLRSGHGDVMLADSWCPLYLSPPRVLMGLSLCCSCEHELLSEHEEVKLADFGVLIPSRRRVLMGLSCTCVCACECSCECAAVGAWRCQAGRLRCRRSAH